MVFREYPEFLNLCMEDAVINVLKEFSKKISHMVAQWLRVGFVQSNFNSDNCLVSGTTLDYGPFGFMEKYDPMKNFWADSGNHFSFMNQMTAAKMNYLTFAKSLEPLIDNKCMAFDQLADNFDKVSSRIVNQMWVQKLGLVSQGWNLSIENLFNRLLLLMKNTDIDYTIFWRQLSNIPLIMTTNDYTIYSGTIHSNMIKAYYKKIMNDDWKKWYSDYCDLLKYEKRDPVVISMEMKKQSPKYIPREWMLESAYSNAEKNSFNIFFDLQSLFKHPYDEQPNMESKYYTLTPLHIVTNKPGISSMTCSS